MYFQNSSQPSVTKYVSTVMAIPEWIRHLPFMQSLTYMAYFFELRMAQRDIHYLKAEHEDFTKDVLDDFDHWASQGLNEERRKTCKDELETKAKKYHDATRFYKYLESKVTEFNRYETFLEGAPQSVLQFYVLLQYAQCEIQTRWMLPTSMVISYLCFAYSAADTFLSYPTKV